MLPTEIYKLINEYANTPLHLVIPSITEQECTFRVVITTTLKGYYEGSKFIASCERIGLHKILETVAIYPVNNIQIQNRYIQYPLILSLPHIHTFQIITYEILRMPELRMPRLKVLRIDSNKISLLPPFDLPELIFMSAFSCRLIQIPDFNLPKLKELIIHDNPCIVPDFNYLPNLENIVCHEPLPSFIHCPKLQNVNRHLVSLVDGKFVFT